MLKNFKMLLGILKVMNHAIALTKKLLLKQHESIHYLQYNFASHLNGVSNYVLTASKRIELILIFIVFKPWCPTLCGQRSPAENEIRKDI